jgi:hypothetical protein
VAFVRLELRTGSGEIVAVETVPAGAIPQGSFATFTLTHEVPYGAAYLGRRVQVGLRFSGAGAMPAFDNISACVTDVLTTTSTSTSTTSTTSTSSTSSTTY